MFKLRLEARQCLCCGICMDVCLPRAIDMHSYRTRGVEGELLTYVMLDSRTNTEIPPTVMRHFHLWRMLTCAMSYPVCKRMSHERAETSKSLTERTSRPVSASFLRRVVIHHFQPACEIILRPWDFSDEQSRRVSNTKRIAWSQRGMDLALMRSWLFWLKVS
jgi:ferredoxin